MAAWMIVVIVLFIDALCDIVSFSLRVCVV